MTSGRSVLNRALNSLPLQEQEFVYTGSTNTDNLSIDSELNKRIGKAAMTLSKLTKCVWSNNKLSDHTKVNAHQEKG